MSVVQSVLHAVEVGKARAVIYMVPLLATVFVIALLYDFRVYHGLNDAQSMDNAQLARQITQRAGFTTKFLRPYAIAQLRNYAAKKGGALFPTDQFPAGTPHILPDTYNAPGYPYLLAGWFRLLHIPFDSAKAQYSVYPGDLPIPWLNQIFVVLTALLVFGLGHFLFDHRVAWVASLAFLGSDMIWQYSITALSTSLLMFLVTALFFVLVKIYCVAEAHFDRNGPFWPAWIWTMALSLFLVIICLTRLHLLVLLMPILVFLALMPRTNYFLLPLVALVTTGLVAPWFWHVYKVCGNPMGSNLPQLLHGNTGYAGNQIYCQSGIPSYEQLFKDMGAKEIIGFRWHFEHAWELLGSSPMIVLFGACLLHQFRRGRVHALFWFIIGSALCIVAVNNLGITQPTAIDSWNTLVVLFPGMLVIGSALFFILLDRLDLQFWHLNNLVIIAVLGLAAMPLTLSLGLSGGKNYNYPPYFPPGITQITKWVHPDEWMTSDMPWATAWYGDRASIWLPDSIKDFENLHDEICPTGVLLLTPVTLDAPVSNLISGEYRDWYPLLFGPNLPPGFPLTARVNFAANGFAYHIFSDTERWK
jgi:hypothetical protein